jgi:hypothetical protein
LCISFYILCVQQFLYRCPSFYPHISFILSSHILIYPTILSLLSCYFIPFILLFYPFYPDIYPAGYSIRSWADPDRHCACLIGPSFACPAQQQGKPLCFYFPAPRCGHRCLPLLAAPAPGPSLQRHRLPLLPAPPGIGGAAGVGGSGERGRRCVGGDEGVGYRWRRRALAPIVAAVAPALIIYCNKSCTNRMRGVSHEQAEPNHTKTITRNIILSTTNTTGS